MSDDYDDDDSYDDDSYDYGCVWCGGACQYTEDEDDDEENEEL